MAVYIPSFLVLRGRPRFFLPSGFQLIMFFGNLFSLGSEIWIGFLRDKQQNGVLRTLRVEGQGVIKMTEKIIFVYLLCIKLRGVFIKRPNFLNGAPTNTENAPNVRFRQETAICPVSLWALVVERHELNWARAQAVRRMSDKVTMKELEEQRVCVKFCCKLG